MSLLGVDIGTTHSKVAVYDALGRLLAHDKVITPRDGEVFDAAEIWRQVAACIQRLSWQRKIDAIAVASMGESGVLLDAYDEPVGSVIPWFDTRASEQMKRLQGQLGERWYQITGLHPSPIHSVNKWYWWRDHHPELWQGVRTWLPIGNWISFKLCGEQAAEASLAARTMACDVSKNQWSEEVLGAAGLSTKLLPPIVRATDTLGAITRDAAELTGLPEGTPVIAGGHDHICAALAAGALSPNLVLDSSGTAEALLLARAGNPNPREAGGFGTGAYVLSDYHYLMGGMYSSGGVLAWAKDLLGAPSFEVLHALAMSVPAGSAPLFIAHFYGDAPPVNDPTATGAFLGVTPGHGAGHLARAVYEGIACEVRRGVEALEHLTCVPVETLLLVGSAADDAWWCDIRRAVLDRPLTVSQQADMVTLGAALVAGLGVGLLADPQDAEPVARNMHPDASTEMLEQYAHIYARYLAACHALANW